MNVIETKSEGLRREYRVAVPATALDERTNRRLQEVSRTIRMPGFRPGKVPLTLVRKKYGDAIRGEILEQVVGESSQAVVNERGLRVAGRPEIDIVSVENGADLEYVMAVEVLPEVSPPDYDKIVLERLVAEADPAEVDRRLETIAGNLGTHEPIAEDRGAEAGDIVVADMLATVEGEPAANDSREGVEIDLGDERVPNDLRSGLLGVRRGESRTVTMQAPGQGGDRAASGSTMTYQVSVRDLRRRVPAAIDDALAQRLGRDSIAALRTDLLDARTRELKALSRSRLKRSLLDALATMYDFEVPPSMVERELASILRQATAEGDRAATAEHVHGAADDGHHHDHDHDHDHDQDDGHVHGPGCGHDVDAASPDAAAAPAAAISEEQRAEFRVIAERRVRLGLVLAEVGRVNNLHVTPEELSRAIAREAMRYPGQERAVVDYFRKHAEAAQALAGPVLEDKVVDFIVEMGTVTERKVAVDDLVRALGDDEEPATAGDTQATTAADPAVAAS
jgi:trigger factor